MSEQSIQFQNRFSKKEFGNLLKKKRIKECSIFLSFPFIEKQRPNLLYVKKNGTISIKKKVEIETIKKILEIKKKRSKFLGKNRNKNMEIFEEKYQFRIIWINEREAA